MKESELVSSIVDYLEKRRVFHYRNNTGAMVSEYSGKKRFMRFGAKGSPDIICVIAGRYVGLEAKVGYNKQSDDQKAFQTALLAAGGIYFVVRSIDEAIEAVEDAITRLRLNPAT